MVPLWIHADWATYAMLPATFTCLKHTTPSLLYSRICREVETQNSGITRSPSQKSCENLNKLKNYQEPIHSIAEDCKFEKLTTPDTTGISPSMQEMRLVLPDPTIP